MIRTNSGGEAIPVEPDPVLISPTNLSEGRRAPLIAAVAAAAEGAGAQILDLHADRDHNRSVLTVAAGELALANALVAAGLAAQAGIDLRDHTGVHPRMGAIDVVPFVPLNAASIPAARRASLAFAHRLWEEAGIPIFFYGEASLERRCLPEIRRRAFRDLAPDVGGPQAHPSAGATAVGVRGLLVAYNVNLATGDLDTARSIAAAIRSSNGGLAHVRALGLSLASRGIAQVSMNLIDPLSTGVQEVFDAVHRLAGERGVEVLESEIVGLAPRGSLPASQDDWAVLLLTETPRVLEDALARHFAGAVRLHLGAFEPVGCSGTAPRQVDEPDRT
jgi:glutamate formiminotransferase